MAFTYPFCYTPDNQIVDAASKAIKNIEQNPELHEIFREGKMLGVLLTKEGHEIYAFSGLAGGRSTVPGFAPPILDTTQVDGLRPSDSPDCDSLGNGEGHRDSKRESEHSAQLQDWLFSNYIVHNAKGQSKSIKEIFAELGLTPPGGTGECAAPKMLEEAYRLGLTPLKMGEFWYGESPRSGEIREHGRFYPSCTGKCGPLLSWMMQGLEVDPNPLRVSIPQDRIEIIAIDPDFIVVNKPSGMLCVPGKTGEKSLLEVLQKDFETLLEVHRLDMDTSGVIVYARNPDTQRELRRQFEARETQKSYVAHLCPGAKRWKNGFKGTIALPIGFDYYDRPRQMIDRQNGKPAITRFEVLAVFPDGSLDVRFFPQTGRTHQLRVHAASAEGLAHPIQGDKLYGSSDGGRLMLHAESLCFTHPRTGERVSFSTSAEF